MRRTVAKIHHKGIYRVVQDDTKLINPYTIYFEHYDNGFHSKKIVSYADFTSCMYYLTNEVSR